MNINKMMTEIAKPSELGNLLDQMMRERGMKVDDLSGHNGLPTEALLTYLRGERDPVADEISTLCWRLGVTPYAFTPKEALMRRSGIRFGYHISPIDMGFRFLWTVDQFRDQLRLEDIDQHATFGGLYREAITLNGLDQFELDFERAKHLARDHGWEGDCREGPFVMPVLVELEVSYAFVWKQNNNGSTFVLSPVPLSYLETF